MGKLYYKHYVCVDASGNIINGWSDGVHSRRTPSEDEILLSDKGDYQFRIILDGIQTVENPPLYTFDMIPLYKWDGERVLRRSESEISADRVEMEGRRAEAERERIANATDTVLLEMVADQEERICLLEMGVNSNDI